ncbi:MAG: TIGR04282 family arsenosugar biosynthesis glycosyltransferase [Deltaproteobacteria bacterium]|nr:TIGR04282 family arsenosugar biosynthesis glycosyltransferase [Deltaproteobacteria bacterium]
MGLKPPLNQDRCLAMMIRHPEPGQVKTRLAKRYGDAFAAELYGCFVDDLIATLASGNHHLEIFFTPARRSREIAERFGVRFSYTPQEGRDIGERMERALRSCFARGFAMAILIGSDFPDLTAKAVEEAFEALEQEADAVVGPALDGGYYLIGFRAAAFDPGLFRAMPWGTDTVFQETVDRLRDRGRRVHLAQRWRDIDRPEDLEALQARHGNTAFSRSRTMRFLRCRSAMLQPDQGHGSR